jgi:nicotinic acid mononucleotide adenylyltransferase
MCLSVNTFEIDNTMSGVGTHGFLEKFLPTIDTTLSQYYFIMGLDNAVSISSFTNYEKLVKTIPFIIVSRGNFEVSIVDN